MGLFEELKRNLEDYLDEEKITNIHEAFLVAEKAHQGQKRYTGDDYISHPIMVASILAKMRLDYPTVMAALLHDVIEDTEVDKTTLIKKFGDEVAELVDGVSKLTQIHFESRVEAQAENFRKMLLAMAKDIRVIIIKLADRLHNMRTLSACPPEKRRRIAKETLDIYAPIANRLGMHKFYIEFEDLGFSALYPMRYRILKKSVQKARGNRKTIMQEIEHTVYEHLKKHQITVVEIKGREKHLYSIYRKMKNKHMSFTDIMDVYAFRVIVDDIDTCYRALGAVHSLFKPVMERFKDYIAIPKANSYQALHTTLFGPYGVPIEIQIRTIEMNQVAESGIAAHWLYKSANQTPDLAQLRAREWLKSLMEMQATTKSPLEFLENVKTELIPDEVYVFTPKGDILELPSKATAVDFAYAVHTDIGNSCIAAKINRRLAPLSTMLLSGQTVEIITAPGARPNPAWLNFVITSKSRSNIRDYIKSQRRVESLELGNQLLDKTLLTLGTSQSSYSEKKWHEILKRHHYKSMDDLYEAIGLGNLLPIVIARQLAVHGKDIHVSELEVSHKRLPLYIKGSQGMVVQFASCCHPIPGDLITGVFNAGQGLIIHMSECQQIAKLCGNPDKCIEVEWEDKVTGEFGVDLQVEVENQRGVLAKLASAIAAAEANIEDISIDTQDGRFSTIRITVSVRDRVHLARIMRRIREVRVVTKLARCRN